jgi:hypothetical protein
MRVISTATLLALRGFLHMLQQRSCRRRSTTAAVMRFAPQDAFAHRYNHHRRHNALDGQTPAEHLKLQQRSLPTVSYVLNPDMMDFMLPLR